MDREFFIKNRNKLIENMSENSIAIFFAGYAPRKSGDENYEFTPNRNFYYLSGDDEEADILMVVKGHDISYSMIFARPIDAEKAKWVGATYTFDHIKEIAGIDFVYNINEFEESFNSFVSRLGIDLLYLDLERQGFNEAETAANSFANVVASKYPGIEITNCYQGIAEFRMIKEKEEVEEIKNAIHITATALNEVKNAIKPNINEKELDALFAYHIFKNGASDFAFKTIAASGKNSTTLHYSENNCIAKDGDVILFDLGAEYNYYKADISRTYPVNGKFNARQQQIYDIVKQAQQIVFENVKPGKTIKELNDMVINFYADKLREIGLIKDKKEVSKYYFHSVSHHLGLDTHDAAYRGIPLEVGNVITVEPGLYIEEESIGVRIEDDILITEKGCEILSAEIAK